MRNAKTEKTVDEDQTEMQVQEPVQDPSDFLFACVDTDGPLHAGKRVCSKSQHPHGPKLKSHVC